jgi:erythritol transport system ATP-binding protein
MSEKSANRQDEVILRTDQITKAFPGTVALKHVDFNVYRGKVNVLVGENGAGKSTLTKILAGVEVPTKGSLYIENKQARIRSFHDAVTHGIGMIHQELNLFPNLNVAENIFIAQEIKKGCVQVDHRAQIEEARKLLDRLEADIDPRAQVADLRIGQQQLVEIAKALALDTRILIMDEPTSALSEADVAVLFKVIKELKNNGVSIIYISHRLEELIQIGDYISILRDGYLVEESAVKDIDISWIISSMVGEAAAHKLVHSSRSTGEEVLRVDNLCLPRAGGGFTVDHLSIHLNKGEILGVYGLMGAGRSEFFECLIGLQKGATGKVFLDGRDVTKGSVGKHIKSGMALIPEDRQREGLVQCLPVNHNMILAAIWKFAMGFHIRADRFKAAVTSMIKGLSIKVANADVLIRSLSGGNQQKVVIGKALLTSPKVLLMDEPTRGIDVGAKAEVFDIMNDLVSRGISIIFVTSELKEILAIADRIIVMCKGKVTGEFSIEHATEEKLVRASAIGHKPGAQMAQ